MMGHSGMSMKSADLKRKNAVHKSNMPERMPMLTNEEIINKVAAFGRDPLMYSAALTMLPEGFMSVLGHISSSMPADFGNNSALMKASIKYAKKRGMDSEMALVKLMLSSYAMAAYKAMQDKKRGSNKERFADTIVRAIKMAKIQHPTGAFNPFIGGGSERPTSAGFVKAIVSTYDRGGAAAVKVMVTAMHNWLKKASM